MQNREEYRRKENEFEKKVRVGSNENGRNAVRKRKELLMTRVGKDKPWKRLRKLKNEGTKVKRKSAKRKL